MNSTKTKRLSLSVTRLEPRCLLSYSAMLNGADGVGLSVGSGTSPAAVPSGCDSSAPVYTVLDTFDLSYSEQDPSLLVATVLDPSQVVWTDEGTTGLTYTELDPSLVPPSTEEDPCGITGTCSCSGSGSLMLFGAAGGDQSVAPVYVDQGIPSIPFTEEDPSLLFATVLDPSQVVWTDEGTAGLNYTELGPSLLAYTKEDPFGMIPTASKLEAGAQGAAGGVRSSPGIAPMVTGGSPMTVGALTNLAGMPVSLQPSGTSSQGLGGSLSLTPVLQPLSLSRFPLAPADWFSPTRSSQGSLPFLGPILTQDPRDLLESPGLIPLTHSPGDSMDFTTMVSLAGQRKARIHDIALALFIRDEIDSGRVS